MVIMMDGTSTKFPSAATPPEETIPNTTMTTPRPIPANDAISTISHPTVCTCVSTKFLENKAILHIKIASKIYT
jgi:hypothetical protein